MKRRTTIGLSLALAAGALAMGLAALGAKGSLPFGESGERVSTPDTAPCPSEMAFVPPGRFCVDKWEAHVLVQSVSSWDMHPFNEPLDAVTSPYRAASAAGVKPQAYVSGVQATKACAASGKRLCSMEEFRAACRGPKTQTFPYGNVKQAGVCNDARPAHPFGDLFGNAGAPELYDRAHLDDPRLDLLPATVADSGAFAGCISGYGAFDMVGNLHEWIDDPDGTFLGGYYNDDTLNGAGCLYVTTAHTFDYHDYSTGFRCCEAAR